MSINKNMIAREEHFANKFNNAKLGFKYHSGYINSDSHMFIKCDKCGEVLKRSGGFLRKVLRREKDIFCDQCEGRTTTNELTIPIEKKCIHCGKIFTTTYNRQSYCLDECYRKHRNQKLEIRKRLKLYELIDNGAYDSSISLETLIIRDRNRCHICEGKCNKNDFEIIDDNFIVGKDYPSIDHIVPVSKEGSHTWDNVKLAHHYCNTIKSNS